MATTRTTTAFDPEREVADKIIAAIEASTPPWRKPWTGGGGCPFPLRATGEPYRGINVLLLWLEAAARGLSAATWMTYNQAQALGGQVRKGETSSLVIKYGLIEPKEGAAPDSREGQRRPYLRTYRVFNADQVDGLPDEMRGAPDPVLDLGTEPNAVLAAYFGSLGATVETTPEPRAYYHPARDVIHLPPIATFHTTQGYYETLGHEAVHWTGHGSRLDRLARCRDREAYAFEELVAEVGQCLLFARLGLTPSIDQSAAYVEGWLKALREDKRAIFRAATEAQKAVDLIAERCGGGTGQAGGATPAEATECGEREEAA